MTNYARSVLLVCLLAAGATAQAPFDVGWRDAAFANPTGTGSAALLARIFYPAAASGAGTPVLPTVTGWPVVVFLHGFGGIGSFYVDLATAWAERGHVAVMSNTAQFAPNLQRDDGIALFAALVNENQSATSFLHSALDMTRAAVAGHSMGGGNAIRVLAANPGYAAGCGFAPWAGPMDLWPQSEAALVQVPLLLIHGAGDAVVPWQTSSQAYFDEATAVTGVKCFYLLDSEADHSNVVFDPPSAPPTSQAIFARTSSVSLGWFYRWLGSEPSGLEQVLGPDALAEPHLLSLQVEVEQPQLWNDAPPIIGSAIAFHALAESGDAAIGAAVGAASIPTPYGVLGLDPSTLGIVALGPVDQHQLLTLGLTLPMDPSLVGIAVFMQAFGVARGGVLRLSNVLELTIGS